MATCSSAEDVIESANIIKADSALIHRFTHGTASQTVQLGTGAATPTLRKLVSDVRDALQDAVDSVVPAGEAVAITSAYIDALFE